MQPSDIPEAIRQAHAEWKCELAYALVESCATYRLSHPTGAVRYVKVARLGHQPELAGEAERLRWAAEHLPVPMVLQVGRDARVQWLLTNALPGVDATHERLRAEPERLVRLLARGLRQFHRAPTTGCPFDFRIDQALAHVQRRVDLNEIDSSCFNAEHRHLTPTGAVAILERDRPQSEQVVLCHGDYCFPNILIENWSITGFVDLGELALADRWYDLAVGTWTTIWNLGAGWEETFLAAYGIEPDWERIRYYRLLYDLVS
jgi:kanamycin kinase